ncbi:MAG: anaerobic ribonucleoside-triphosphate reductase activating protein [Vampirovibrionales bacterium]|nr:anaerobic ribonucleoside-triphosphate reductase activating protein [Vampirovibrionales bacterium]
MSDFSHHPPPPDGGGADIIIGGLIRASLVDFPGRVSAVVFTQGCNFRCPFCHNPALALSRQSIDPALTLQSVLAFLEKRRGKLDGVVICGGEPTLQPGLGRFMETVRAMGYALKLDTNGARPDVLADLLGRGLLDFVAMDVKAPLENYAAAAGLAHVDTEAIARSIELIRASGVAHEFRTTVVQPLHTPEDLYAMGRLTQGAQRYVLQRFKPGDLVDPDFARIAQGFPEQALADAAEAITAAGTPCMIR